MPDTGKIGGCLVKAGGLFLAGDIVIILIIILATDDKVVTPLALGLLFGFFLIGLGLFVSYLEDKV